MATYSQKLKDPRWQKKRLRVFDRDNWTCQVCKRQDQTLNVHHCIYVESLEPWQYSTDSLTTLCESCHHIVTRITKMLKETTNGGIDYCPIFTRQEYLIKLFQYRDFRRQSKKSNTKI